MRMEVSRTASYWSGVMRSPVSQIGTRTVPSALMVSPGQSR